MAQDGGHALRLSIQAERDVDLHHPEQRLGGVGRGLILINHNLIAAHRRAQVPAFLVVAPDLHLVPGQVIAHQVALELRIARVVRIREAGNDIGQRGIGPAGGGLIALHVRYLGIMDKGAQVPGVRGLRACGAQGDIALHGVQGRVVAPLLIRGVGTHQLGARRPGGVGVESLHLREGLGGGGLVPGVQFCGGLGVERLCPRAAVS